MEWHCISASLRKYMAPRLYMILPQKLICEAEYLFNILNIDNSKRVKLEIIPQVIAIQTAYLAAPGERNHFHHSPQTTPLPILLPSISHLFPILQPNPPPSINYTPPQPHITNHHLTHQTTTTTLPPTWNVHHRSPANQRTTPSKRIQLTPISRPTSEYLVKHHVILILEYERCCVEVSNCNLIMCCSDVGHFTPSNCF